MSGHQPWFHLETALPTRGMPLDRKSTRLNSSHITISYAVFCLKKKTELRRQSGGPQGGVVQHHHVVQQQAARVLRNGNAYALHLPLLVLHVVVYISQPRQPFVP